MAEAIVGKLDTLRLLHVGRRDLASPLPNAKTRAHS